MVKRLLEQYVSLQREIKDLEKRIEELERLQKQLQDKQNTKIRVKGGLGGSQVFHIDGYCEEEMEELELLLRKDIRILKDRKARANECVVKVDQFINTLDDSRMRRMIEYRYLKDMSWYKVAMQMGIHYTEESCRKQVERFLKEKV